MNTVKTVAIATLALGLSCFAQPSPRQSGAGRGDRAPGNALKSYLSLTDAQVETLRAARTQDREAKRAKAEEMRAKHKALREQMNSDQADPAAVGNLMLEMRNARKQAQAARKEAGQKLLATLTPEQKTKLQELQTAARRGAAAREAMMLGLIEPPAGAGNGAGRFGRGGRGPGAMGFRGGGQRF